MVTDLLLTVILERSVLGYFLFLFLNCMSAAYLGSFFIISKTRSTEYVCKLIYVVVILDYNTTQVYRIMNIIIIVAEVLVSNCAILEAGDLESNFEVAFLNRCWFMTK